MSATRDQILESATRILNNRGLSALGTRAVAEDLGLSPGNVSYHFRRKEDLIAALAEQHSGQNRAQFDHTPHTLAELLEMFRALFHRQYQHRGLMLALPDMMETFEAIRTTYRRTERTRRQRLFDQFTTLRERNLLAGSDRELQHLVAHVMLAARFWIGEARVSYNRHGEARIIGHYVALLADLLRPHATRAGQAELARYDDGWIDDAEPG